MKRLLTFSAMMFLLVGGLFAQKLSYQAVVRNSANELVVNTPLTVEVGVLDAFGTVQYAERHTTTSNQNGLIVLTIGEGTVTVGTSVADVDWNGAVIQSVVKDGSTIVATINSPVNAVPYALQAASAGGSISQVNADWNATSGVAEILHKPTIPTTVAELTDAGIYVTNADLSAAGYLTTETDPTVPAWAKESVKPTYDYSEITNTPDMTPYLTTETDPTVNNSTITIQKNGDLVGSFTLNQAGDQTINITVPTSGGGGGGSVPQTINISGNVITLSDGGGSVTLPAETDPTVPAWAKESTKPAYDYAEITNTPDLSVYLTTESDPTVPDWAKEANKPAYDYSEIANTPDLSGYLTAETDPTVPDWAKEANKPAYDYSEIANTPDLSGYLTAETDPTVPDWAKEANKPTYDYSEITGTPTIPTVNDGTLTIQKNGVTVGTFTANQAGSSTLNITITAQDILDAVNGMTDAEKAALCSALNCSGGGTVDPTTFTCGTSKMTDADGNEYETVLIGSQCWTKTNLRVAPAGATDATSSGVYSNTEPYYYVNSSVDAATYGYYYNWEAAKLACPAGWHLPSDAEWNTLEATVSGSDWQESYATATGRRGSHAGKLAGDGWYSSTTAGAPGNATDANHNASGFGAVPAGSWSYGFNDADYDAYFWSSTEYGYGANYAWSRTLDYYYASVRRYSGNYRNVGFSVRCLRD